MTSSLPMEYRTLGKTGLRVSVLGFGASPLGGVFGNNNESEGIASVHKAIDLGINFFDVSPYYGLTKAETVLGRALKSIPRDKYYLATKVGRYGPELFDFSKKRVVASIDESLARLQVDYVDLIQCHDVEFGSLEQVREETIPALREVQKSGKVRFVGITGLPLKIFTELVGTVEIDTILSYCHYSLNDTALDAILPQMEKHNVGIINASPFSMGLLTERGAPEWHPAQPEIKKACAQAVEFTRSKGVDISKLAYQFALANPKVQTTLAGFSRPANVEKNVKWLDEPLDEELLKQVQEILAPVKDMTWPSGRPENN